MQQLITIFMTLFLVGLADGTELATLLYASGRNPYKSAIFLIAAGAWVLSTGLAVIAGVKLGSVLSPVELKAVTGSVFILIGFWVLLQTF